MVIEMRIPEITKIIEELENKSCRKSVIPIAMIQAPMNI